MYFPKEDFDPGMIDDLEGEGVDISSQTNLPIGLNESLFLSCRMIERQKTRRYLPKKHP